MKWTCEELRKGKNPEWRDERLDAPWESGPPEMLLANLFTLLSFICESVSHIIICCLQPDHRTEKWGETQVYSTRREWLLNACAQANRIEVKFWKQCRAYLDPRSWKWWGLWNPGVGMGSATHVIRTEQGPWSLPAGVCARESGLKWESEWVCEQVLSAMGKREG